MFKKIGEELIRVIKQQGFESDNYQLFVGADLARGTFIFKLIFEIDVCARRLEKVNFTLADELCLSVYLIFLLLTLVYSYKKYLKQQLGYGVDQEKTEVQYVIVIQQVYYMQGFPYYFVQLLYGYNYVLFRKFNYKL